MASLAPPGGQYMQQQPQQQQQQQYAQPQQMMMGPPMMGGGAPMVGGGPQSGLQSGLPLGPPMMMGGGGGGGGVNVIDVWILDTRIARLGGIDFPHGKNQGMFGLLRIAQALRGHSFELGDFKSSEVRAPKACPLAAGPFFAKGPSHSETQVLAAFKMFEEAKMLPDRVPIDPYNGLVGDDQVHFLYPKEFKAQYLANLRKDVWATEDAVYSSELIVAVPRKHEDLSMCIHRVPVIAGRSEDQMFEDEKKRHAETCLGKPYRLGERPPPTDTDKLWEQVGLDQGQYRRDQIPNEVWYGKHPEWCRHRPPIVLTMAQVSRLPSDDQTLYKKLEAQKLDPNAQRQWAARLQAKVQGLFEQYRANGWSLGGFAFRSEWSLQELLKVSVAPPALRPGHSVTLPPCFSPMAQRTGLLLRNNMELMTNQAKRGKGRQAGLVIQLLNETVLQSLKVLQWPEEMLQTSGDKKFAVIDEDPYTKQNAWAFLSAIAQMVGTVPEAFISKIEPRVDDAQAPLFASLIGMYHFRVNTGRDDAVPQTSMASLAPGHIMQTLASRFGYGSAAASS